MFRRSSIASFHLLIILFVSQNISDEKFEKLFQALPNNEHLEVLSLTNVGLTDKTALLLAEAIEKNKSLRVLNVETNFINPPVIVKLVSALLNAKSIEEFRASNQVRWLVILLYFWLGIRVNRYNRLFCAEILCAGQQNRDGDHGTGRKEYVPVKARIAPGVQ